MPTLKAMSDGGLCENGQVVAVFKDAALARRVADCVNACDGLPLVENCKLGSLSQYTAMTHSLAVQVIGILETFKKEADKSDGISGDTTLKVAKGLITVVVDGAVEILNQSEGIIPKGYGTAKSHAVG